MKFSPLRRAWLALLIVVTTSAAGVLAAATPASASPANDNFANAQAITGQNGSVNGDNTGATVQPGEHVVALDPSNTEAYTVWYAWRSQRPVRISLTCSGPGAVFIGAYTAFDAPIAGPNECSSGGVTFTAATGTTYFWQVGGSHVCLNGPCSDTYGPFTLTWAESPPDNDNFAAATALSTSSGTKRDLNTAATKESGEPAHAGNAGGASVWYSWTPNPPAPVTVWSPRAGRRSTRFWASTAGRQ